MLQSPRLLPTAGVCDQRVGATVRLLPTAGVCDQRVSTTIRLLPTAGVCDQHVGLFLRLLPTAGVCNKHIRVLLRLLPTVGFMQSARMSCIQTVAHHRCMQSACVPKIFFPSSTDACYQHVGVITTQKFHQSGDT